MVREPPSFYDVDPGVASVAGPRRVSVSEFKARCLGLFEEIRETGEPVMVTKRGIPIAVIHPVEAAPGRSWIGCMKGTARITGDVIGPALSEDEWTAGSLEDWDEAASLRKRDGGGHGG